MAIAGYGIVNTSTLVERGRSYATFTVTVTAAKEVVSLGVNVSLTDPSATVHSIVPNSGGTTYTVTYSTRGQDDPTVVDTVTIATWAIEATIA